jgi:hypothetical protein
LGSLAQSLFEAHMIQVPFDDWVKCERSHWG